MKQQHHFSKKLLSLLLALSVITAVVWCTPTTAGAKSYVTTARFQKFSDQQTYSIPKINLNSADAKKANAAILKKYNPIFKEAIRLDREGVYKGPWEISYRYFVNGDVLSLYVVEKDNASEWYLIYNFFLPTGKLMSSTDILKYAGANRADAHALLRGYLEDYFDNFRNNPYVDDGMFWLQYNKSITTGNLNRARYFLGQNGRLMTVYYYYSLAGASTYYELKDVSSAQKGRLLAPKITAFKNVDGGVKISWKKNSAAKQFRLYMKAGSSWKAMTTTTAASFFHKTSKSGKKYVYSLRCLDQNGSYLSGYNPLGYAHFYVAIPKVKAKSTSAGVKLTWNKVSGASKYRVELLTSNSCKTLSATKNTTFTHKHTKEGVTYTYVVRALNSKGKLISGGKRCVCTYRR